MKPLFFYLYLFIYLFCGIGCALNLYVWCLLYKRSSGSEEIAPCYLQEKNSPMSSICERWVKTPHRCYQGQ